ncbi:MAG TPA: hypothetical protein VIO16_00020 [Dehalococcoidia bacterium]
MIDTIVVYGDEKKVATRLQEFIDAGAGEVIAAPLIIGDRRESLDRATSLIAALARSR